MLPEVMIVKVVHGGQGLADLPDGRKVFVWNALPGETVRIRIIKNKRSYAEAIAEEIIVASPDRVVPIDENYLATSPWQILSSTQEDSYKIGIVRELMQQAGLDAYELLDSVVPDGIQSGKSSGQGRLESHGAETAPMSARYHYRNKMEYSFWGDDQGLHLALHIRGSHGKQIVSGSALAMPAVDAAANLILAELQERRIRASDLKSLVIRASQNGDVVAALFVRQSKFPRLRVSSSIKPDGLKGIRVYFSNPRSPASVRTRLLYEIGNCELTDSLLGRVFVYDVDSFFQVNIPVYESVLKSIRSHIIGDPIDMYAGVGSIGLSVADKAVTLIEMDSPTVTMARRNAADSHVHATVIEASSEEVLEQIDSAKPLIVDPPRAGLHARVITRCLDVLPPQIIYLSCNPATQSRDLSLLQSAYTVKTLEVYNFFPHTPHIEVLAVLVRK
ncbi:class I SAM-dependent RNA methyltransferase [Candidatus Saccharibacteria bacterium]|nr:class I SAM-dependent RNA methyltransferase [Candidatus Saccharibacteria bacterium]